jgi:hypothetical protein
MSYVVPETKFIMLPPEVHESFPAIANPPEQTAFRWWNDAAQGELTVHELQVVLSPMRRKQYSDIEDFQVTAFNEAVERPPAATAEELQDLSPLDQLKSMFRNIILPPMVSRQIESSRPQRDLLQEFVHAEIESTRQAVQAFCDGHGVPASLIRYLGQLDPEDVAIRAGTPA